LCKNCLLKHFTEGKIEGSISEQLLNDHKGKRGYWKLALKEAMGLS
jgi:hypothetical protein